MNVASARRIWGPTMSDADLREWVAQANKRRLACRSDDPALHKGETVVVEPSEKIYIIRGVECGTNFVYVKTREDAQRICSDVPDVFTWEPLELA